MLAALLISAAAHFQEDDILFQGTGTYQRPVTTANPQAQPYFDQGLRFLFAFNHGEAKRLFRAAVKRDPKFAMAYWGLATANGPHVNLPVVPPEDEEEAFEALKKARANMATCKPADKALIMAASKRFRWPQPKDRGPLDRAYATAMEKAWADFPRDPDIGAFYAESVLDLRPWNYWTAKGQPQPGIRKAVLALERVMKLSPKHPFALHLYIHAMEASPTPEKAVPAADALRDLQPALGHNVHMPSHIDIRVGAWEKAVVANEKAIAADAAYRAKRPEQFVYRVYMAHNHHMLAFAEMMTGRSAKAIEQIDLMLAEMPVEFREQASAFVDNYFAMPYEVRLRFGKWDEALALPEPAEYFPLSRAMHHAARSVAYSAKGDTKNARREQWLFTQAKGRVPKDAAFGNSSGQKVLEVAWHMMNGELLVAEGNLERAVAELRLATAAEDKLKYNEPPDWIQPTRHVLGALLLRLGRYAEAERAYREDLALHPENGWSLYGLASSLKGQNRKTQASAVMARFEKVWAHADTQITSSCLCMPGQ